VTLGIVRALVILVLLALLALGLVCVLVVVQGQRDEARRADAIVVLYPAVASREHLEHALNLYQEGHSARLVLAGEDIANVQAALVSQGIPEAALLAQEESGSRYAHLQGITQMLYAQGLSSVLLVDSPDRLLLDLKMARDMGLIAYGSPVPGDRPEMQEILRASLDYWQYVLLQAE
jgi:uncharacterized SAM-binding protein YcdF (DUF218 family)